MDENNLKELCKLVRYYILTSTTEAGSGHPTSSMSATELMAVLFFGGFLKSDLDNINDPNNDRIIFSKGHASPLFYSLYAAAGKISFNELLTLRKFNSRLEGHPTLRFLYTEVATGSLGQGLSVGVGIAINAKYLDKCANKVFVLMGDSETAEGSVWEAAQSASYYDLDNLVAILDVNRLGQRGQTMLGHDLNTYEKRFSAFGWEAIIVEDGHDVKEISDAYTKAINAKGKPVVIIAKTIKGKGVSFLEDKEGWHGKVLSYEQLTEALKEIGGVNLNLRGDILKPAISVIQKKDEPVKTDNIQNFEIYEKGKLAHTRKAYGQALVKINSKFPNMVVLDAEVGNSTFAETFKKTYPKQFFEMFIAEQNMVSVALGLSKRGRIPFVSTFSAFLTRAFDQIRMSQYSDANIKFVGSHCGVAIGEDGSSQMGLEDIAMFRSILNSVILYPADAVCTEKLVEVMAGHNGISYLRTTRKETEVLYGYDEEFKIGGSKTLRQSEKDIVMVIAAGTTLYEALSAYEELKKEGIFIRVVDLYSVKPLDEETLNRCAKETRAIVVVEDHYPTGGIGEAVAGFFATDKIPVHSLCVRKIPRSGTTEELLDFEEISKKSIIKKVKELKK